MAGWPYIHRIHSLTAASSAIEYAVVGLGLEHIVVCGHTDCGAMKALLHPKPMAEMPAVAKWLGHCRCSIGVFHEAHDDLSDKEAGACSPWRTSRRS